MTASIFDDRRCTLGEGPLWHPGRDELFWFDILGKRLLSRGPEGAREWQFEEHVSAAGRLSDDALLVASETALFRFDLGTGARTDIVALEADFPATRSNDGRADPQGGFWIGTMGKRAEKGAGAIYRFHRGELRRLFSGITIPNAICFAPDSGAAFFCDTTERRILRQALDAEGWPKGSPELFVDLDADGLNPDGAVVDAEGCLWNAQWGAGRVARYAPDGRFLEAVEVPARQPSCPAFGGADLSMLHVTTATEHMEAPGEGDGLTYSIPLDVTGQREHRVIA